MEKLLATFFKKYLQKTVQGRGLKLNHGLDGVKTSSSPLVQGRGLKQVI